MFAVLIGRLFILQVVHGEEYADNFELQITKTRTLDSTRGNIYDRNGKLIAGNKVSYSVTIEDNGTYNTTKERILSLNAELYRLCKLIRANGDSIDTSTFPIEVDENGAFVFTGEEGTTRDRFRADIYGQKKIDDMSSLSLLRGADAAILGSRGSAGAIVITLKTGKDLPARPAQGIITYTPLGYSDSVEFYQPIPPMISTAVPQSSPSKPTLRRPRTI